MVSNLRAQSGIARGVDAILEECAAVACGCGEKARSKTNLSPRQGRCNTAECVCLKSRQVACAFGVGKFAHQYRKTGNTGIFFRVKAESHYQGFTQPPTYW